MNRDEQFTQNKGKSCQIEEKKTNGIWSVIVKTECFVDVGTHSFDLFINEVALSS